MALTVAELRAVFSTDMAPFSRGLRRGVSEGERQFGQLDRSVQRTHGFLRQAGATAAGFLGANVIQSGLSRGFNFAEQAVFGFNDQLDRSHIAFTTMLGSGRKADAFLRQLQAFAKKTPFEFPDLVTASQRLLAMGFTSRQVLPTMTAVGDAVAGLGGDPETMNRVITALGQIRSKGKASAEEMMQLTEAGIPAWEMLADKIGVSVPRAMKLVSKGSVDADTTIAAVTSGMEKRFGGMMAKQSTTMTGALSNIKDAAVQSIAQGARPAFDLLKAGAVDVADWLSQGHLQRGLATIGHALTGQTASKAFGDIETTAENLWHVVGPLARGVGGLLLDALRGVGGVLVHDVLPAGRSLTGWMSGHETLVRSLAVAVLVGVGAWKAYRAALALGTLLRAVQAGIVGINAAMAANPIGIVIVLLAALAAGLIYAYKHSKTFRDIVNGAFHTVADAGKWMWDKVLRPTFAAIVNAFLSLAGSLVRGAAKAFGWVPGIGPKLKSAADAFDRFRQRVNSALDGIHDQDVYVHVKASAAAIAKNPSLAKPRHRPGGDYWSGGFTGAGGKFEPAGRVHRGEFVSDAETTRRARPLLEELHRTKGRLLPGYADGGFVVHPDTNAAWFRSFAAGANKSIASYGYPKQVAQLRKRLAAQARAGGTVWPTIGHLTSTYPGHDGVDINAPGQDYGNPVWAFRGGRVSYAGWGRGYGHAVFEKGPGYPEVVYGHLSKVLVRTGELLRAGQLLGRVGATGHATGPHLHFGHPGGTYAQAMALLHGAGTGGGPAPHGSVQKIVHALAARRGWGSGAQWSALANIISHESGWNPRAQNPHSSAYGLFQFLNSTWPHGHKTSDPALQTRYGLNYIASKYGSPAGAWGFWKRHHWYDDGGWLLPGVDVPHNATGKPEAVLTPEESAAFKALARQAAAGGTGGVTVAFNGNLYAVDVDELTDGVERKFRDMYAMAGTP